MEDEFNTRKLTDGMPCLRRRGNKLTNSIAAAAEAVNM